MKTYNKFTGINFNLNKHFLFLLIIIFLVGCTSSGEYRLGRGVDLSGYKYIVIGKIESSGSAEFSSLEIEDELFSMGFHIISKKEAEDKEPGSVLLLETQMSVLYSWAGVAYHYDATVIFKDFYDERTKLVAIGRSGSDRFDSSWSSSLSIKKAMKQASKAFN